MKQNYDNSNYEEVKKVMQELNVSFIDTNLGGFTKEKNPLSL